MSKPRWAEDESIKFFPSLSLEFPSKHKNVSCAVIFYRGGSEWVQFRSEGCVVGCMQKRSSVWKLHDVTGSFLSCWHHSVWVVMGHVPEISCLIGSETLKEMTLPQLPLLSLCQRGSLALLLLLHLLISVCRWSNLYLSECAALLYSVTWGNWNWMPAELQQTANGAWDTPWFSHWPDSLICKKLFLMNTLSRLLSTPCVKCCISSRLGAVQVVLLHFFRYSSKSLCHMSMYECQSHLCQITQCLFILKRHGETAWSLVIIGPIPGATLCSFKQNKVEFITDISSPTGLAMLLKFILPLFH